MFRCRVGNAVLYQTIESKPNNNWIGKMSLEGNALKNFV